MPKPVPIESDQARWSLIGNFYVRLAADILGGEINRDRKTSSADIFVWKSDAAVEVKGFSSRDFPKLFVDQLESYRANLGFPTEHCWYALFSYQNKERRVAMLTPTLKKLENYLAANTDLAMIFDLSVMEALRREYPTTGIWRRDAVCPVLKIRRSIFDRMARNPSPVLKRLGLQDNYTAHILTTRRMFGGYQLNFQTLVILPASVCVEIKQRLSAAFPN